MNGLSDHDREIVETAKASAKSIRNTIASELLSCPDGDGDDPPLTIFMAGAPGAGKTEASKEIASQFNILRVDPDDFRGNLPGYDGSNSRLFQGGVSLIVERVFDRLVKSRKSFLLDGTSANLKKVRSNIQRALQKGRLVRLWYVYQDPLTSWEFVQAREIVEGRGIPLESFIDQYFNSRLVVNEMKKEFGDDLSIDVLVKDFTDPDPEFHEDVASVDCICPTSRTREDLARALAARSEPDDTEQGNEDSRSS